MKKVRFIAAASIITATIVTVAVSGKPVLWIAPVIVAGIYGFDNLTARLKTKRGKKYEAERLHREF